ncbi:hypothetical protein KPL35_15930 [Clostridium sp. CF011]|uniref:hypothetical protein n=1 Tax=Clostridium sp. CF011 TaxID=2843318 RepID=UPI001C0AB3E7|nr:hypothetical protein [Clostridium sp. CF011]MBU3093548.1 hypothetical protein [Clostridium sp. CF011]WAG71716.1 hypothetical protein LL036_18260 [Clostridium sp. CF011]
MKKNKTNKLILIIAVVTILFSITGCSSSASSNAKTEKLALTKENVQKVFSDEYSLSSINLDWGNVRATFTTKKDVNRKEAIKLIKDIESKAQKNFKVTVPSSIELKNIDNVLIGHTGDGKIFIGYSPDISIEKKYYVYKYSMANKFNLLNPVDDVKVTATDSEDGDVTSKIKLKNPEVLTKIGEQTLNYEVTDSDGNTDDNAFKVEITK